jgi:ankyrin repeat protein
MEKGAELETKFINGQTPLSCAAKNGHEAVVKLLLEKGAELETKSNSSQTPLSYAADYGHEAGGEAAAGEGHQETTIIHNYEIFNRRFSASLAVGESELHRVDDCRTPKSYNTTRCNNEDYRRI